MGVFTNGSRARVDELVPRWRTDCLIGNGSVLFPTDQVWTPDNFELLFKHFNEDKRTEAGDFEDKFEQQLSGQPRGVVRLAAEVVLVYFLFVGWQVGAEKQRELVRKVLGFGAEPADPVDEDARSALDEKLTVLDDGIGNPGPGYLYRRPYELMFIVELGRALKQLEQEERHALLDDPAKFQAWIDDLAGGANHQFRHIVLHLLWPERYERIASGGHKSRIVDVFRDLVPDGELDEDQKLAGIRAALEEVLPEDSPLRDDAKFDFYESPIREVWWTGSPEAERAIEHKGQLVFYGPPGTSKTYEAWQLAEGLIRSAALRAWGAGTYFTDYKALKPILKSHVHYLQLHPAYSYEDFIGGLRLNEQGATVYERGFLPKLVDTIEGEKAPEGQALLPHVLILDEMNRADLSQVLGEAFSRLERSERGKPVQLMGTDPETGERETLQIPSRLFVIGTMNLIDQSVEQIDFALRRRFLWRESGFDSARLRRVLEESWSRKLGEPKRRHSVAWEKVQPDMERLVRAAEELNRQIGDLPILGTQYEIGHAYFFDVVELLDGAISSNQQKTFLWAKNGPREALIDLWELAIRPLLQEYLAGVDSRSRDEALSRLQASFYDTP